MIGSLLRDLIGRIVRRQVFDGAGGVLLESGQHFWASQFWWLERVNLTCGGLGLSSPFSEKASWWPWRKWKRAEQSLFAIRDVAQSLKKLEESPFQRAWLSALASGPISVLDKMAKKLRFSREKLPIIWWNMCRLQLASRFYCLRIIVQQDLIKLNGDQTILLSSFSGGYDMVFIHFCLIINHVGSHR